jgi:glucose/arabinose dehydrogenase
MTRSGYSHAIRATVLCAACLLLPGSALAAPDRNPRKLPLNRIKLPAGFSISLYAPDLPSAREMALSSGGVLYVGSNKAGKVYGVTDRDKDNFADQVYTVAEGKWLPVGVAMKGNDLYYSEVNAVWKIADADKQLGKAAKEKKIASFPDKEHHGWKFIAFGPDGKLYVPVGAPCNVCEVKDPYSCILRMNADGSKRTVVARGMRNTVGFDWHPVSGEMYWTDNGRDELGDDLPPDELNRIRKGSGVGRDAPHYGFPFWHGRAVKDPQFGAGRNAGEFTLPVQELGPHVASIGMCFYTGKLFPARYKNAIFIAEHGSWNRSSKIGYRITCVRLNDKGESAGYEVFAEGWLGADQSVSGRPADVLVMPDGSLLVSDDHAGCVYRITYSGK